jgi:hypothetical protein
MRSENSTESEVLNSRDSNLIEVNYEANKRIKLKESCKPNNKKEKSKKGKVLMDQNSSGNCFITKHSVINPESSFDYE